MRVKQIIALPISFLSNLAVQAVDQQTKKKTAPVSTAVDMKSEREALELKITVLEDRLDELTQLLEGQPKMPEKPRLELISSHNKANNSKDLQDIL